MVRLGYGTRDECGRFRPMPISHVIDLPMGRKHAKSILLSQKPVQIHHRDPPPGHDAAAGCLFEAVRCTQFRSCPLGDCVKCELCIGRTARGHEQGGEQTDAPTIKAVSQQKEETDGDQDRASRKAPAERSECRRNWCNRPNTLPTPLAQRLYAFSRKTRHRNGQVAA